MGRSQPSEEQARARAAEQGMDPERVRMLDAMAERGTQAARAFRNYTQEQVDSIAHAMVRAGMEAAKRLAEMAAEETTIGVVEDKYLKNTVACEFVWNAIRNERTVGIIREDAERNLAEAAEPIGLILSLTPITNPTSTALFKSIVAAKTANTLIVSAHSRAWRCTNEAMRVMYEAGLEAGAPRDFLQWIDQPARLDSLYLMEHPQVQLIDATGGRSMVKVAYSSGKPALGVGSGNTATYLHRTADLDMAVVDILTSKTFDNGVICASEGTLLIDHEIFDDVLQKFRDLGAYLCTAEETRKLETILMEPGTCAMHAAAVGRSAGQIAEFCGISAPKTARLLLAPLSGVGRAHPLSAEKLCPVLGVIKVFSEEEALEKAREINAFGGTGHTASVFTEDGEVANRFGQAINAGRIIVNSPSSIGAMGGVYNDLVPTFSFGCGTGGGNSVMDNVTVRHYLNVKRIARRTPAVQWYRVPSHIFFNRCSLDALREIDSTCAVVLTSRGALRRGYVEEVQKRLRPGTKMHTFTQLEADPDLDAIRSGTAFVRDRKPDLVIAVGGGSVLDAAKMIRLLSLAPHARLGELSAPFLDIRKRAVEFPKIDPTKMKLVAIPTTSGTGSEVSPFAVINDTANHRKLSFVDTSLVPDVAILEPELTLSLPADVTAATGMDALTHALEAGMSIYATEFTDSHAYQAARLIFYHLPRVVKNGSDLEGRTKMLNAASIAGLAFSNASVGLAHAMSHATGALFPVAHGALNGIFLPAVVRFNAGVPVKITPNPNVHSYQAPRKIAGFCEMMGIHDLSVHVEELRSMVGLPANLRAAGVTEAEFGANLDTLVELTFRDPSLISNPRRPLLAEIRELFEGCL